MGKVRVASAGRSCSCVWVFCPHPSAPVNQYLSSSWVVLMIRRENHTCCVLALIPPAAHRTA